MAWAPRVCASALLAVSQASHSALSENLTIANPKALALGNAVTADPPGIDSIHFNPAGLARVHGREGLFKLALAHFNLQADFGSYSDRAQAEIDKWALGETDPVENSHSESDTIMLKIPFVDGRQEWPLPMMIVPTGGAAFRPEGKDYTLGTAAFAPLAAGYLRDDDDPGRFMGKEMALTRITYFSPTIGFQLNDEWSVGAGIHFSYAGISAYTDLRVANLILGVVNTALDQLDDQTNCLGGAFTFCGESLNPFDFAVGLEVDVETPMSVNAVFGALWEPTPWFTWGFVYQTEASQRMTGSYRMTYSEDWQAIFSKINDELGPVSGLLGLPVGLPEQTGDATINLKYPAHFSTGVSVQVLPRWKVNVDAKWTDWGVWDGLKIEYDQKQEFNGIAAGLAPEYATDDTLIIPRHYESTWNLAFGVEHQYSDRLTLRFGWEPRKSSIPDDKQGLLLPFGDANLYSFGFGYDWREGKHFDFAFGYLRAEADIPANSSTNSNSEATSDILYNPYAGLDIETSVDAILIEASYTWQF
ncbi:MAG: outer membrane protein transport protein [Pseudomonadota bacterium]|nr:outer membrane protein transport protein [Pseudomonadota bacterium]